ncbi:receptor for retinol uptake stra6-like [Brachionichthys hirsutus]|uniref:receptor for retinol uptake stra6-like n=1 Tax=Brachionichthys hirsutus TaxID=412623 RepID=UPI003604A72E
MNHSKVDPFEYSYYDYSDWYSDNAEPTRPPKEIIPACDPTVDGRLFHTCMMSISVLVVIILAVLTRKHKLCQGFSRGSSSIFSPVSFLDQTQKKGLVLATYGLVFSKLATLVIAPDPLPFSRDTPADTREYLKLVAVFYYPILYYPLLICSSLQHKAGAVFGMLLSFGHFGVLLWQKVDCPKTPEIYKFYALLASLPQLACLAYLCIQFPLLFVRGPKTDEDLDSSFYTDYVKFLLKKRPSATSSSSEDNPTLTERILMLPKNLVYLPEQAFRVPLTLAVSTFIGFVTIYHTALLLVVLVVPTLHIVRAGIDENIAFLLLGFGIVLSDDRMEVVKIVTFYTWLLEVSYLCAVTLSCLVSLLMLMRSMIGHRSNLRGLYKGDVYSIWNSHKTICPSKPGVVCWMGLTGYQAAVVCLGMVIQTVAFFICFLFLVFMIIVPVCYGRNMILFEAAGKVWPAWLALLLVTGLQHVAAKFAFIKKEAGTRALQNRDSLFLLTYLLFLVNAVLGLIVSVWRTLITALYNITHLGRMDTSLLHRTAEPCDPAYRYYTHSLKVEVSQSHPVMKAFCRLLLDLTVEGGRDGRTEGGVQEDRLSEAASRQRSRLRWQLLYTLVNNPSLLGSRKHFQTPKTPPGIVNGTPNHSSERGSKKEASEPVQSNTPTASQDETE